MADSDQDVEVVRESPVRPDRKRIRLRDQGPAMAAGDGCISAQAPIQPGSQPNQHVHMHPQPQPARKPLSGRNTTYSGARFSELKRAFGEDADNGKWWDRRAGSGLEYLSGRSIESFPLLRPLPESELAAPPPVVLAQLMRVFEAETVRRMPNGITRSIAACIDAERPPSTGITAYLCGHIDNFCQKFQPDARYGCGYRNIQVMMSFLVRRGKEYADRVYGGRGIPSVPALQRSIELSWKEGFDVDGAGQLGWHLEGKDTWIGATDAAAFLRFLGFEAVLVEFSSAEAQAARAEAVRSLELIKAARAAGRTSEAEKLAGSLHSLWVNAGSEIRVKGLDTPPSTSSNSHTKSRSSRPPGPTAAAKKMLPWMFKYFQHAAQDGGCTHSSAQCVVTAAPPLYLQYQGHSTTVMGIERRPYGSTARGAAGAGGVSGHGRSAKSSSRPRSGAGIAAGSGVGGVGAAVGVSSKGSSGRLPGQRSLPEMMSGVSGRRYAAPAGQAAPTTPGHSGRLHSMHAVPEGARLPHRRTVSERELQAAAAAAKAAAVAASDHPSHPHAPDMQPTPLQPQTLSLPAHAGLWGTSGAMHAVDGVMRSAGGMPSRMRASAAAVAVGTSTHGRLTEAAVRSLDTVSCESEEGVATLRGALAASLQVSRPSTADHDTMSSGDLHSRPRGAGGRMGGRGGGSYTVSRSRARTNTDTQERDRGQQGDNSNRDGRGTGRGGSSGGRRAGGGAGRGGAGASRDGRRFGSGGGGGRAGGGPRSGGSGGGGTAGHRASLAAGGGVVGGRGTDLTPAAAAAAAAEMRARRDRELGHAARPGSGPGPGSGAPSSGAVRRAHRTADSLTSQTSRQGCPTDTGPSGSGFSLQPSSAPGGTSTGPWSGSGMVDLTGVTDDEDVVALSEQAGGEDSGSVLEPQVPMLHADLPGRTGAMTDPAGMGTTVTGEEEETPQWEYVLYVLDPQVRFEELRKALQVGQGWQKLLRRLEVNLRMPAYQVMAVRGILPMALREQSKKLTSTRVM